MFARFYDDELRRLNDLGAEFGLDHGERAEFLAVQTKDPDVGRLLQGFAFLAAGIRERIEDDLPELTHSLLQLLFPHYLRTQPATTVVQFEPKPGMVPQPILIPRGTRVAAPGRDGSDLPFRTTMAVTLLPFSLQAVRFEQTEGTGAVLRLQLRPVVGADPARSGLRTLRVYLGGGTNDEDARLLFLLLLRRVSALSWRCRRKGATDWDAPVSLAASRIRPAAFDVETPVDDPASTALLPFPVRSFPGYRLLQEYFHFDKKFLFVDIDLVGKDEASPLESPGKPVEQVEVTVAFERVPDALGRVDEKLVRIGCTPVVNLFPHPAHPVQVDHRRAEYLLRPTRSQEAWQVFTVDDVYVAAPKSASGRRTVPELYSFATPTGPDETLLYHELRTRPSVRAGWSPDTYLRFVTSFGRDIAPTFSPIELRHLGLEAVETVSVDLTCTSGNFDPLPPDIPWRPAGAVAGAAASPGVATFRSVGAGTRAVDPPLDQRLHWHLISQLSLNSLSLASVDNLRRLLQVHDFHAMHDEVRSRRLRQRMQGLQALHLDTGRSLLRRGGIPARLQHIRLDVLQDLDERTAAGFGGEGSLFLFGCVLSQFLRHYAAAGSLSRLTLKATDSGVVLDYPPLEGAEVSL